MPYHLISDRHERVNEKQTVPGVSSMNIFLQREKACETKWEK